MIQSKNTQQLTLLIPLSEDLTVQELEYFGLWCPVQFKQEIINKQLITKAYLEMRV